jgi:hypothetical protein
MTEFIKVFAIILAFIAISKSYLDYRKGLEPRIMFIFWLIVWTAATILIAYPLLIERIAIYTKDSNITIGSVTSVAFVFMLFIVYRVYAKSARIEYQLTQLIRELSIEKNLKKKDK